MKKLRESQPTRIESLQESLREFCNEGFGNGNAGSRVEATLQVSF